MATGISTQQPPAYTQKVDGHRAAVVASFLGWTLDAFDFFLVTYTLTAIAKEFGRPDKAIALSLTITLMFRPVGACIFGLMADRFGRRIPLMIDLVFYSVVEVATGLVHSYAAFLVLRALFGIGMGGEWGVGASLAMEKAPAHRRGIFSGWLQEGYACGNLLAAISSTSSRSRSRWCRRRARARRRRRGWSIACFATCWSTSPAIPTAPRPASTSC